MKKKNIIISIACSIFFIICVGATIILFPKVKEETIAYSTSIEDLFEKEGHFYVYFNRKECPYCDNIEDDIKQFKKENAVYEIDEDCEKCGTRECRCGRKPGPDDGGCYRCGEENRGKRDEQIKRDEQRKQREPSS